MLYKSSDCLRVEFTSMSSATFHWIWLRDHCQCSECFNSNRKHKTFDSFAIPSNIQAKSVYDRDDTVYVEWEDGHKSAYEFAWLKENSYDGGATPHRESQWVPAVWPAGSGPARVVPLIDFLTSDLAYIEALEILYRYGLVVLKNDQKRLVAYDAMIDRLAGFSDRTYFGSYFDLEVKPEETTDSIAFSTRALPFHTDLAYYDPAPDIQFLFGLDVDPLCAERSIGNTKFIDALDAAHKLKAQSPDLFTVLATTPVLNRASFPEADKTYESRLPIITLGSGGAVTRILNNPSKMFFEGVPVDRVTKLYEAYRAFKTIAVESSPSYSHAWTQGDMVLWDNRRILHGRGDFGSQGLKRILRGGYFRDSELLARTRFFQRRLSHLEPLRRAEPVAA